ncbi:MAG: hypothetical protein ABSF69_11475 [Polyangiaceae bacterium]|jgi:hypothetical protein
MIRFRSAQIADRQETMGRREMAFRHEAAAQGPNWIRRIRWCTARYDADRYLHPAALAYAQTMGLFEKDYVIRQIEKLNEFLAAIAAHLAGGRPSEALALTIEAQADLAGPFARSLDRLDAASVVAVLGRDKAKGYTELLHLEADARRALGETASAHSLALRADAIARVA